MKHEVTRTVHPIGQGGFYTEDFNDGEYRIVYDCGGGDGGNVAQNQNFMVNYLNKNYLNKKIDAIFISHLHADHVNGLQYLLDNNDVRYLFLPQLDDGMRLEQLLYNELYYNNYNQNLRDFIIYISDNNNTRYRNTDARIIRVRPPQDEYPLDLNNNDRIDLTAQDINSIIKSGDILYIDNNNYPWLFIPYNPPASKDKSDDFSNNLQNELIKYSSNNPQKKLPKPNLDPQNLSQFVKSYGIKTLKKIYESYFGKNHNAYSMTLFSGLTEPYCYHYRYFSPRLCMRACFFHKSKNNTTNCLYTGDFEPGKYISGLRTFYQPLWETIRAIQVPHHGSKKNYDRRFYDYTNRGFISAGTENKYTHPNPYTITNMVDNECFPIIVTEESFTEYEEIFLF